MNKDDRLLTEAYELVAEKKKKLVGKQKDIAAAVPPPDEITGADFKALKARKKKKVEEELQDLYGQVIEEARALVKKKHYNEYKNLTKWLLDNKDKHGKKDYEKAKARRDEIVGIFKQEGMEPHEVKDSFAKKVESNEPDPVEVPASVQCTICGDEHNTSECPEEGNA
jgi:hypothetical protein